jgi:D-3-phosphoglycerate dehydrogenase
MQVYFDFDNTILTCETLDKMAQFQYEKGFIDKKVKDEIISLTTGAMQGHFSFQEALKRRVELLTFEESQLGAFVDSLQAFIDTSFFDAYQALQKGGVGISIISGGFREIIVPLLGPHGIPSSQVYANTLLSENGIIVGVDTGNPLAEDQGKVACIQQLEHCDFVVMIGDGYTDFEVKDAGLANVFLAYTGSVCRDGIAVVADASIDSFDAIIPYFKEQAWLN